MSAFTWAGIGIISWVLIMLIVWALCAAAGRGDRWMR